MSNHSLLDTEPKPGSPHRPGPPPPDGSKANRRRLVDLFIVLTLLVSTFSAFQPTLKNDFVDWDDWPNLVENQHVRGLTAENLIWMFTDWPNSHMGHYQPLTWLSFALDYELWGEVSPRGVHRTSLAIHAINGLLFYWLALVLLRLSLPRDDLAVRWGAALAALLFALHPLRVESVAWATERRDLLSAMFFILALLAYLRSCRESGQARRGWLIATVLLQACACLSKVICVTFPAVVIVLDFYPLRRFGGAGRWRRAEHHAVWLEKIPFLLVTLAGVVVAPYAQGTAMVSLRTLPLDLRVGYSCCGLLFYVLKLVWPANLIPFYALNRAADPLAWHFIAASTVVVCLTIALLLARGRFPAGLAVWITYVAMLSPVLNIMQNGTQFAADRYTYISCLGLVLLAGGALSLLLARRTQRVLTLATAGIATLCLLLILITLTRRQTHRWHDSLTLWTATAETDPDNWVANRHLADLLMDDGRVGRAADHYRRALAVEQHDATLCANASVAFAKLGDLEAAERYARRALHLAPDSLDALVNAGYVRLHMQDWEGAIRIYRQGVQRHPQEVLLYTGLARGLVGIGDHVAALAAYRRAISLDPQDPVLYGAAGELLLRLGRFSEAEQMVRRVLEFEPGSEPAARLLAEIRARAAQAEVGRASDPRRGPDNHAGLPE